MNVRHLQRGLALSVAFGVTVACSDDKPVNPPERQGAPIVDAGGAPTGAAPDADASLGTTSESRETTSAPTASSSPLDAAVTVDASASVAPTSDTTSLVTSGSSVEAASTSAETTTISTEVDAAPSVSSETTPPGPVEFTTPRGPCDLSDRVGRFIIESQEDFGIVQGTVSDAVVPSAVPDVVEDNGVCQINRRRTLSCLPTCQSGETCGEDGTCIPYPSRVFVGEVVIEGLTKTATMVPQGPSYLYFAPGADNPPYTPGAEVVFTAAGDASIPGFHLFGLGSEPLANAPAWVLEEGQDLVVTWPASDAGVATTVFVELTIDQHGTSPLSLNCEFPDTGIAAIPAEQVSYMVQAGVSGFPNGRITRRTADHVDLDFGCIELAVGSPRSASVAVAGHTPCNGPEDCPENQTCNLAVEQCQD